MKRKIVLLMALCVLLLTGAARAQGVTVDRDCLFITALYDENGKFLDCDLTNVASGNAIPDAAQFANAPAGAYPKTFTLNAGTLAPYAPETEQNGDVYAILYDDGTMVFQYGNMPDSSRGTVKNTYAVDMEGYGWEQYRPTTPWYNECQSIKRVDFADKIRPVSTMYWFFNHKNLTEVSGIGNLNTSDVTNMGWMFYGCSELTSLDVSDFHTSNVTNMSWMFSNCSNLTDLDVSSWDTSNVTNMSQMFRLCTNLKKLDVSGFHTSNITNMRSMFAGCFGLTELDLSNFDTSNVTDMCFMFEGCRSLTTIHVSERFTVNQIEFSSQMFSTCPALVGGAGTVYDENHTDAEYARIDAPGTPGYFTLKK